MDAQKPVRDLLPKDMIRYRHAQHVFLEAAIRWGYQEIKTPTIEPISLFTAAGTLDPRMLDNLYSFLDWDGWSGQRVVLRPDGTIPTSRLFIERFSKADSPVRLCYVADMFSYDEDGTSEHRQCGVELIEGHDNHPAVSDAEVTALSVSILKQMGFPSPLVRIGYPPLIREFLDSASLSGEQKQEILDLIQKKDRKELTRVLTRNKLEKLLGLMDMKSTSADFIKNVGVLLPKTPGIGAALDDFSSSVTALQKADIPFEITFSLPLNFEYYTGLVMEAYPDPAHTTRGDVVMSGGRYDNLVSILSEGKTSARAVGCILKIERIIGNDFFVEALARRSVLVVPGTDRIAARRAVSLLRDRGIIAEMFGVGQDPGYFGWLLSIDGETVHVTDSSSGRRFDVGQEKINDVPDLILS